MTYLLVFLMFVAALMLYEFAIKPNVDLNNINDVFGNSRPQKKESSRVNVYDDKRSLAEYPDDIIKRVELDFPNQIEAVKEELESFLSHSKYCRRPRLLRCILAHAKGNYSKLKESISIGKMDYRDLILLAEYNMEVKNNPIRLRDYTHPFGKENLD